MWATTPTEGGENMAVLLIVCSRSNTHILSRDRCPPPHLYWLCHFLGRWASWVALRRQWEVCMHSSLCQYSPCFTGCLGGKVSGTFVCFFFHFSVAQLLVWIYALIAKQHSMIITGLLCKGRGTLLLWLYAYRDSTLSDVNSGLVIVCWIIIIMMQHRLFYSTCFHHHQWNIRVKQLIIIHAAI